MNPLEWFWKRSENVLLTKWWSKNNSGLVKLSMALIQLILIFIIGVPLMFVSGAYMILCWLFLPRKKYLERTEFMRV